MHHGNRNKKVYYVVARQPTGSPSYWTDCETQHRQRNVLSSYLNELVLGRLTQTHQNHSVSSSKAFLKVKRCCRGNKANFVLIFAAVHQTLTSDNSHKLWPISLKL
ncbi:hypothetical protein NL108_014270 [Boleophthalmus pectinirostris]|nr:hypothetical protein NL108_014270 [Boleophthalmus pectinirostris]